jgi:DNA-binding CsgD family transcriptional regulator
MTGESILSEREKEILSLVAEGLTNREIAQRLTISHNTVKVHLSNIFEKTGASSRTEATVYAIEHRIVDVPGGENQVQINSDSFHRFSFQSVWVLGSALFLIIVFGLVIGAKIFSQTPSTGANNSLDQSDRWQELAPLPEPRVDMAAVAYSGEIYVIGGEGPEGVSSKGFRYLPDLDEWLPIADKPTPVTDINAVVIGEKIYIPGGICANGQPTDIMEIYDPRQDIWETGVSLPKGLSGYALADFEGKMYIFGGWDGKNFVDLVWSYNFVDNVWMEKANLKGDGETLKAVSLNDYIFLIEDGQSADKRRSWKFFPSRDQTPEDLWVEFNTSGLNLQQGFGLGKINNTIYLVGQDFNGKILGFMYFEDSWEEFDPIVSNESTNFTIISEDSYLYIISTTNNLVNSNLISFQAIYYKIFFPIYDQ